MGGGGVRLLKNANNIWGVDTQNQLYALPYYNFGCQIGLPIFWQLFFGMGGGGCQDPPDQPPLDPPLQRVYAMKKSSVECGMFFFQKYDGVCTGAERIRP